MPTFTKTRLRTGGSTAQCSTASSVEITAENSFPPPRLHLDHLIPFSREAPRAEIARGRSRLVPQAPPAHPRSRPILGQTPSRIRDLEIPGGDTPYPEHMPMRKICVLFLSIGAWRKRELYAPLRLTTSNGEGEDHPRRATTPM